MPTGCTNGQGAFARISRAIVCTGALLALAPAGAEGWEEIDAAESRLVTTLPALRDAPMAHEVLARRQ